MIQYYYIVKLFGKTVKTIAKDGKEAKNKVCQFENILASQIKSTKRGEALNFIELPND